MKTFTLFGSLFLGVGVFFLLTGIGTDIVLKQGKGMAAADGLPDAAGRSGYGGGMSGGTDDPAGGANIAFSQGLFSGSPVRFHIQYSCEEQESSTSMPTQRIAPGATGQKETGIDWGNLTAYALAYRRVDEEASPRLTSPGRWSHPKGPTSPERIGCNPRQNFFVPAQYILFDRFNGSGKYGGPAWNAAENGFLIAAYIEWRK